MKKTLIAALLLLSPVLLADEPSWRDRVTAAKALTDPAEKAKAMLVLVKEALWPQEVRMTGAKGVEHVEREDNEPAPIVNFDPRLNQKRSARPRNGGATRSLENNAGYYFSADGVGYIVIGPAGLDPRSAAFTRLITDHEMFHAENHVGDPRPMNDRELETWSTMFVRHFDEIHPYKQRWAPMLHYYDNADEGEQKAAVARLVAYYRAPGTTEEERKAFDDWLERRKKDEKSPSKMPEDIEAALTATSPAVTQTGAANVTAASPKPTSS